MNPFPETITIREKYGPAMAIQDQAEADEYFAACVAHSQRFGLSGEDAEAVNRANLGYYAGYYDEATRARVERLFRCAHPVFGAVADKESPSPEEALEAGFKVATK